MLILTPLGFFGLKNRRKNRGEICLSDQEDRRSSRSQNEIESFLNRESSRSQSVRTRLILLVGPAGLPQTQKIKHLAETETLYIAGVSRYVSQVFVLSVIPCPSGSAAVTS
jgi:hypothetical protein